MTTQATAVIRGLHTQAMTARQVHTVLSQSVHKAVVQVHAQTMTARTKRAGGNVLIQDTANVPEVLIAVQEMATGSIPDMA